MRINKSSILTLIPYISFIYLTRNEQSLPIRCSKTPCTASLYDFNWPKRLFLKLSMGDAIIEMINPILKNKKERKNYVVIIFFFILSLSRVSWLSINIFFSDFIALFLSCLFIMCLILVEWPQGYNARLNENIMSFMW